MFTLTGGSVPAFDFLPADVIHEFFNVVDVAIFVVNVEGGFIDVNHPYRCGHPQWPHRLFVADDIVEFAVDRVDGEHRPASGGPGLKIRGPLVEAIKGVEPIFPSQIVNIN
jgi:hypothetical protein